MKKQEKLWWKAYFAALASTPEATFTTEEMVDRAKAIANYTVRHVTKSLAQQLGGSLGDLHVRDPNNRCDSFEPGTSGSGECNGDGHYLCKECKEKKV